MTNKKPVGRPAGWKPEREMRRYSFHCEPEMIDKIKKLRLSVSKTVRFLITEKFKDI